MMIAATTTGAANERFAVPGARKSTRRRLSNDFVDVISRYSLLPKKSHLEEFML